MDLSSQHFLLRDYQLDKSTVASSNIKSNALLNESHLSAHDSRAGGPRLTSLCRRHSCRRGAHRMALLAAFASLTAILFFVFICRITRSGRTEPLTASRKLADDGDLFDSSKSAVSCYDTESESDESTTTEPTSTVRQLPETSSQQMDGALSALTLTTETGSLTGRNESETSSEDDQPSTSTGKGLKRRAPVQGSQASSKRRKQPSPGDEDQQGPRNPAELEVAQALLDLHPSPVATSELPHLQDFWRFPPSARMSEASPQKPSHSVASSLLIPVSTALRESPMPKKAHQPLFRQQPSAPFGQGKPLTSDEDQPSTNASVLAQPGGKLAPQESSDAASEEEQSSASSAAEGPALGGQFGNHPFFRTPTVIPADLAVPRFRPELTTSKGMACRQITMLLQETRELLAKPSLTARQLDMLSMKLHQLMAYAFYNERESMRGRGWSTACYHLGRRYLIVDSVLAGLQVLGVTPQGSWWSQFVGAVSHDAGEKPGARILDIPAANNNRKLLKCLVKALQFLKSGTRLSAKETVSLKRRLLCSPSGLRDFKRRCWDPWRQDDKDYGDAS